MIAAVQRSRSGKLLVVDSKARLRHLARNAILDLLRPGDLVIANDAATMPASLRGVHARTGAPIEIRLASRRSLATDDIRNFTAIAFGSGDYRTRTEDRPAPPLFVPGDLLNFGSLAARIVETHDHPRLVHVGFEGSTDDFWSGIARHGRPIQYSHVKQPLALWDVWTSVAGPPVAFEPPSAGFALAWGLLQAMRARGIRFCTLTHAAGISSTGDVELDRMLPFDEAYHIPFSTAQAIRQTRAIGGRVVAIGTTVVRALESAATGYGSIAAGSGIAKGRIGADTSLRIVDAILSGTHEPDSSHYQLLRAFTDDETLSRIDQELESHGYHTHEFGDSVLIERREVVTSLPYGSLSSCSEEALDGICNIAGR